jgi:hypothetical protein
MPIKKQTARISPGERGETRNARPLFQGRESRAGVVAGLGSACGTACMIRSASPALARTGGAERALRSRLASSRTRRACSDERSKSAADCCCRAGQVDMSSPSRSSRSSKSATFIVGKPVPNKPLYFFCFLSKWRCFGNPRMRPSRSDANLDPQMGTGMYFQSRKDHAETDIHPERFATAMRQNLTLLCVAPGFAINGRAFARPGGRDDGAAKMSRFRSILPWRTQQTSRHHAIRSGLR